MGLQTEYAFTLPKGYVGPDGRLHRRGVMRLSTARDEIEPLRDPRITGPDDPYLTILVIARVITELGTLDRVSEHEVEGLFAADLAFLQDLYGIINFGDPADAEALQRAVLPLDEPADEPAPDVAPFGTEVVDVVDEPVPVEAKTTNDDKPSTSRKRSRIEEITPQRTP